MRRPLTISVIFKLLSGGFGRGADFVDRPVGAAHAANRVVEEIVEPLAGFRRQRYQFGTGILGIAGFDQIQNLYAVTLGKQQISRLKPANFVGKGAQGVD